MVDVKILDTPLDTDLCLRQAYDQQCGGVVSFVGTVRNETQGRKVRRLEFECYLPMAQKEMRKIADEAIAKCGAAHVVMHHRIGTIYPGEAAVVIVVSSPHRAAAFEACQYAIDQLKITVPIWKKEFFEDGEHWVSAHP